eukprot:gene11180-12180_t
MISLGDPSSRNHQVVEFTDGEVEVEDLILETIMQELMYGYSSPVSSNEDSQGPYVYPPEANQRPPTGNNPKKLPDRVYEMIHSDIVTRSDSYETKIIVYYRMSGMKSYHCNPIHAGVIVETYASSCASSPCSCWSGSTVSTDDSKSSLSGSDDEEFSMLKLFYQKIERIDFPRHLTAHGKITMTVENYQESMKINQIVIESSSNLYHFRPL